MTKIKLMGSEEIMEVPREEITSTPTGIRWNGYRLDMIECLTCGELRGTEYMHEQVCEDCQEKAE
jgi:hypothetical protein